LSSLRYSGRLPPHEKALSTVMLQWTNISFHCLNSVFAAFEVLCSAAGPQRWCHSIVLLQILLFYIAMAYIIRASAHFYVYDFMDIKLMGALTAAYIFGIGGMSAACFFVVQHQETLHLLWNYCWLCSQTFCLSGLYVLADMFERLLCHSLQDLRAFRVRHSIPPHSSTCHRIFCGLRIRKHL
jgi:hypothetical protein